MAATTSGIRNGVKNGITSVVQFLREFSKHPVDKTLSIVGGIATDAVWVAEFLIKLRTAIHFESIQRQAKLDFENLGEAARLNYEMSTAGSGAVMNDLNNHMEPVYSIIEPMNQMSVAQRIEYSADILTQVVMAHLTLKYGIKYSKKAVRAAVAEVLADAEYKMVEAKAAVPGGEVVESLENQVASKLEGDPVKYSSGGQKAGPRPVGMGTRPIVHTSELKKLPNFVIDMDKQGKHIPGHKNFDKLKSTIYADPKKLIENIPESGELVGKIPVGKPGSKIKFDFGEIIGEWVDSEHAIRKKTTTGTIHFSKEAMHIVPANPID